MKTLLLFQFTIILSFTQILAQQSYDITDIRDFRNNMVIEALYNTATSIQMTEYGTIVKTTSNSKYLFHSQEFESKLNLYLFPSRIYSSNEKRFLQPDPASQYISPYSFVGADPVNYTDYDGKKGKALILFQEDHDSPESMNAGARDLRATVTDAHYVPISDFINGNVGDLPEWNGHVFMKGHVGDFEGREILSETSRDMSKFKTELKPGVTPAEYNEYFTTNIITVDGKEMGRKLRRFSDERGVPIKNITGGGCESMYAINPIREGFMEESKKFGFKKQRIKFKGLKDGRYAAYIGDNTYKNLHYDIYPKETRFYLNSSTNQPGIPFEMKNGRRRFLGFTSRKDAKSPFKPEPYVGEKEIRGLVHGRTPSKFKRFFQKLIEVY